MVMHRAGSAQINTNTHLIKTPRPETLLLNSTARAAERHRRETGSRPREACKLTEADYLENQSDNEVIHFILHFSAKGMTSLSKLMQEREKKLSFRPQFGADKIRRLNLKFDVAADLI